MFPFLIGKVLTVKSLITRTGEGTKLVMFPFLIGKVLTLKNKVKSQ